MVLVTVLILLLFCRCSDKKEIKIQKEKTLLEGVYNFYFESESSDFRKVMIFYGNTVIDVNKAVGNYANPEFPIWVNQPMNYYIENNEIFMCGIGANDVPVPLELCKKKNYDPFYKIISVDTLVDEYSTKQVINLQELYASESHTFKLVKYIYDTITRPINVEPKRFDLMKMIKEKNKEGNQ